MNCQLCQRQLLMGPEATDVSPETAAHLAACADCRRWHMRLRRIEGQVPSLPVPASPGRQQFVQAFIEGAALAVADTPPRPRSRWRYLAWTAGSVAAAGILVACGIFLAGRSARNLPEGQRAIDVSLSDESLAGKLLDLDLRLAEADTPRRRLETLAKLAENLQGESRALARVADAKDLNDLARLYDQVVQDGIVPRARQLPAAHRRQTLDAVADQMSKTKRATEELARNVPAEVAGPLLLIAAASRNGDLELRNLLKEATP